MNYILLRPSHYQIKHKMQTELESKFIPGAILVDTWGWGQTNRDFYQILKRSGDWITIQKMTCKTDYNPIAMTGYKTPDKLDETEKPIRKKLKSFYGKEAGFSLRNYSGGGWCDIWNGKPADFSTYA
jgi:hypothetical protein